MNFSRIGKIEKLPLRSVWPHEALDFTVWLRENIDALGDCVSLTLNGPENEQTPRSEQPVGSFSADLVAEDDVGNVVVIENQLEKSDHDHLGKILTYLVGTQAQTAIWIVAEPRPEHVQVVSWLNESTSAGFYLVKVEAVKIGESSPAPLFTLIVGPSPETREVGAIKKERMERHDLKEQWWRDLILRASQIHGMEISAPPNTTAYLRMPSDLGNVVFYFVVLKDSCFVELYINRDDIENERIFDDLYSKKAAIESDFGGPMKWNRMEGKKSCKIYGPVSDAEGYRSDPARWPELHDSMVSTMKRFQSALGPHIGSWKKSEKRHALKSLGVI